MAAETIAKYANEVLNAAVDFRGRLESGESLSGTPTVVSSPSGISPTNIAVTVSTKTINGKSVPAGKAITFKVPAGGTVGTTYELLVTCDTNSTPAQTVQEKCYLTIL